MKLLDPKLPLLLEWLDMDTGLVSRGGKGKLGGWFWIESTDLVLMESAPSITGGRGCEVLDLKQNKMYKMKET